MCFVEDMQFTSKIVWLWLTWSSWTLADESSCICGISFRRRIVGGKTSQYDNYPWMAVVHFKGYKQSAYCGASVISTRHALTAAHCVHERDGLQLAISIGSSDLLKTKEYQVERVIEHEDYEEEGIINDIAIMVTKKKINLGMGVPICLPDRESTPQGQVKVLGWGWLTDRSGVMSQTLNEVELDIIPRDKCSESLKEWLTTDKILHTQFCTYSEGRDTCQGDSGGPMFQKDSSRQVLVGLVSYGMECGGNDPGVGTNVSSFLNWILENTRGS